MGEQIGPSYLRFPIPEVEQVKHLIRQMRANGEEPGHIFLGPRLYDKLLGEILILHPLPKLALEPDQKGEVLKIMGLPAYRNPRILDNSAAVISLLILSLSSVNEMTDPPSPRTIDWTAAAVVLPRRDRVPKYPAIGCLPTKRSARNAANMNPM